MNEVIQNFSISTGGDETNSQYNSDKAKNVLVAGLLIVSTLLPTVGHSSNNNRNKLTSNNNEINQLTPYVDYANLESSSPILALEADNDILSNYNTFVRNFLENATEMDSKTSKILYDDYLDLMAT